MQIPKRLRASPILRDYDLDEAFAPIVQKINGNLDATSYSRRTLLPALVAAKDRSVVAVEFVDVGRAAVVATINSTIAIQPDAGVDPTTGKPYYTWGATPDFGGAPLGLDVFRVQAFIGDTRDQNDLPSNFIGDVIFQGNRQDITVPVDVVGPAMMVDAAVDWPAVTDDEVGPFLAIINPTGTLQHRGRRDLRFVFWCKARHVR